MTPAIDTGGAEGLYNSLPLIGAKPRPDPLDGAPIVLGFPSLARTPG